MRNRVREKDCTNTESAKPDVVIGSMADQLVQVKPHLWVARYSRRRIITNFLVLLGYVIMLASTYIMYHESEDDWRGVGYYYLIANTILLVLVVSKAVGEIHRLIDPDWVLVDTRDRVVRVGRKHIGEKHIIPFETIESVKVQWIKDSGDLYGATLRVGEPHGYSLMVMQRKYGEILDTYALRLSELIGVPWETDADHAVVRALPVPVPATPNRTRKTRIFDSHEVSPVKIIFSS